MIAAAAPAGAALWFDLSSLVRHTGAASGIQRATSGLAIGLRDARCAHPIRFCHFDKTRGFLALDDSHVERLLDGLGRALARDRSALDLARLLRRRASASAKLRSPFAPGDVLLNTGFSTYKLVQHGSVSTLLDRSEVRYVGFVYDLLPVLFPEWWTLRQQARYHEWFDWTGRHAALLVCCSESTRRDALHFFAEAAIATGPIETVALGDELPRGLATARSEVRAPQAPARPFVLFVSTLEARKNHRLLFQVWRRLLAAHGPARVPELVFVGKRGWLIDDFVSELENARFLDGKIVWRERVDDAELARLYATCLFTVYPSLYEGWGLPVAESLAFGKYCVASNAASLPEVGRDFADYHAPHDVAGATALVERAIFDDAHRDARQRAIRERFCARTWQQSAEELLRKVEPLLDARPDRAALGR